MLNGEICNYRELRAELIGRGRSFSPHGDTEVIVHLCEKHGPGCVRYLRRKLLFYYERDGELWFAAQTTAAVLA